MTCVPDTATIDWEEHGNGRPIVFLHGWTMNRRLEIADYEWYRRAQRLAADLSRPAPAWAGRRRAPSATRATRLDPKRYAFSFDLAAAEKSFARPVLIIAGRQDTTVGYRDAWDFLESYPRATFAILDRAGHVWSVESPDLVDDWPTRIVKFEQSI